MSAVLMQRQHFRLPVQEGPYTICILHRDRWHESRMNKPFADVMETAEGVFRRSGLPVQIRDADDTILYEINESSHAGCKAPSAACRETLQF